jgi:hypothetical protein
LLTRGQDVIEADAHAYADADANADADALNKKKEMKCCKELTHGQIKLAQ